MKKREISVQVDLSHQFVQYLNDQQLRLYVENIISKKHKNKECEIVAKGETPLLKQSFLKVTGRKYQLETTDNL